MDRPGLIVPLVTPYTDDTSSVSEIRLQRAIRWHKEQGAVGLVVGSEAAEVCSLSLAERKNVLEIVMRDAGDLAVYVNITAPTTSMSLDLCQDASGQGAAGAVVTAPWPGGLTQEEMEYYLRAIRRHGRMAFAFLDHSGRYTVNREDYVTPGAAGPATLADKGLEELACLGDGSAEFWTPRGLAHPVGVFGAEYGNRLLDRWAVFGKAVTALLKGYGLQRVGKHVFEKMGVDLGPPRPPFGPLSEKGAHTVDQLLAGL